MLVMNANANASIEVGKLRFWIGDTGASVYLQGVKSGETITGDLIIPSTVNYEDKDYIVVGISNNAFKNNTGLTSVTIPNTVTVIGNSAFYGCTNLKDIYLPKTINFIGYDAFNKTAWLNAQPDGVVYASTAFYTYKGTMPQNTNIVIQDGTTCVAERAFQNCTNLNSIQIPNTVKTIGNNAFQGCTALANVSIPSSVKTLGSMVFSGCTSLVNVTLPNSIPYLNAGVFQNCTSLTSITIPNSVKYIDGSAFAGCTGLTSISIPNSVTGIGYRAFNSCTNLAEISIPSSVSFMSSAVFSNTAWFNNQPDGVVYAGTIALTYKGDKPSGLLTIKDGTTAIADEAFNGCTGITLLRLPSSLKYINNGAFQGCSNMSVLTIPNNVKAIGNSTFHNCTNLTEITFPNSLVKVGSNAFSGTTWYSSLPDGITYAGSVALLSKGNLPDDKTLTIKEGTKGIADYAFSSRGFVKVILPSSLTRIGYQSFYGMTSLQEINIPQSVTAIDGMAFYQLKNLQRVDAYVDPANVTMGGDDFALRAPSPTYDDRLDYCMVFDNDVVGTLHVLPGKEDSFRNSLCWALFRNIVGDLGAGVLGDVDGNGLVNGSDVTALYNYLLNGAKVNGNADVDGNGTINGSDVTALYNLLLK